MLILPYRNPFLAAKAAATLQIFSDNRFILGVGVGYMKEEFEALGVPFAERGALTRPKATPVINVRRSITGSSRPRAAARLRVSSE